MIGFLGGWDHWDDPNRGVRKLALKLRDDEPGVFSEAISNHRQALALRLIYAAFDAKERAHARIILYGQSLGGGAVVNLARKLQTLGIPVLLTVQVDSVGLSDGVGEFAQPTLRTPASREIFSTTTIRKRPTSLPHHGDANSLAAPTPRWNSTPKSGRKWRD